MPSTTARVAINTLTNYARLALTIVVYFFLTPLLVNKLGAEGYGLWTLVMATVAFLGLMDLGFGTGVVKYVSEAEAAGDPERRNRVVSTIGLVYLLVAGAAALGVAVLSLFYADLFSIPEKDRAVAVGLLWILSIRMALLAVPLSLYRDILFGVQKIYLINIFTSLGTLVYFGLAWLALENGYGLMEVAWANLAGMVVEGLGWVIMAFASVPGLKIRPRLVDFSLFKETASFSFFALIVNVASIVMVRMDPFIIKLFLSFSAVAVYAVSARITDYAWLISKQFINVLTPVVAEVKESGDPEKMRFLLINCARFAYLPTLAIAGPLFAVGEEFLGFWLGPDFAAAVPVMWILTFGLVISVPQMVASSVLTMTGHHKYIAWVNIIAVVVNVAISIALVIPLGIIGVALGTLLTTIIVEIWFVVRRTCQVNHLGMASYLASVLPAAFIPGGVMVGLTWALKIWWPPTGLFTTGLVCVPGMAVMVLIFWLFFLDESEKGLVRSAVARFTGRG